MSVDLVKGGCLFMFRRLGILAAAFALYCTVLCGAVSAAPVDCAGLENTSRDIIPAAESFGGQEADCRLPSDLTLLSSSKVQMTYVLNTKSMKFHYPSCASAKKMNNPQTYTGYRDDLIKKGYSPCGRCTP
ncbi:MAG: hypothetical protein Q4F00_09260 [bacterium]|nr:hypothetical protein [bacterium]